MSQKTATRRARRPKEKEPATSTSVKRFDGKSSRQPPAIAFLMQQHRDVENLFDKFENAGEDSEKASLADEICLSLAVHAKIEEELFYPEAHEKVEEEDLIDEATVEHASAKSLIAQIETMEPSDHLFDAKVKVLSEYIAHHVKEEETELFPQAKKAGMDLVALGEQLQQRSEEIKTELSSSSDPRRAVAQEAEAGARV